MKLSDTELVVMQILWKSGPTRAAVVAEQAKLTNGWENNTTYTLISRLIKKNAVQRTDPGYLCTPLLDETEVQIQETKSLLDKMYRGSLNMLVKTFLQDEKISERDLDELQKYIDERRR